MHGVDGISGGTITSDGVTDMLAERLNQYVPFFETKREELKMMNTDTLLIDTVSSFTYNIEQ
jgi:Na+-transporting NADH:ubiquinone oxidoreductase subunit NqrC